MTEYLLQHPVRRVRRELGLSQAQLARRARLALRTVHSVEKGLPCRKHTKRALLIALGLPWERKDELFPGRVS